MARTQRSWRLPVPEPLALALESLYRSSQKPNGLVFPTRTGNPHNDSNLLNRYLKPAGKRIGAPWLSWHSFRRTHATLLSQAGASPRDAQAQLGHADIGTTMNLYTHPTPDHQRAAVEKAGQLVTNGDEFAISGRRFRQPTTLIQ